MNYLLLILKREIINALKDTNKFCELLGRFFLPTFLGRLLVVLSRSYEEERTQRPQLMNKRHTVFHHAGYLKDAL